jgi:hypothetical protein
MVVTVANQGVVIRGPPADIASQPTGAVGITAVAAESTAAAVAEVIEVVAAVVVVVAAGAVADTPQAVTAEAVGKRIPPPCSAVSARLGQQSRRAECGAVSILATF